MENYNSIELPASVSARSKSENGEFHSSGCEPAEADQSSRIAGNEEIGVDTKINGDTAKKGNVDDQLIIATDNKMDMDDNVSTCQGSIETTEELALMSKTVCNFIVTSENGCLSSESKGNLSSINEDGFQSSQEINDRGSKTKRPRVDVEANEPSVHIIYNSLPRYSKQKLEELLQQWSQWHAQYCSSSNDASDVLETGEETYFPAIHVGLEKPSAVSFWMENQPRTTSSMEFISLDDNSVPLYDRGFTFALIPTDDSSNLEGGLELDASRCFNCGSYSHSLKDCPKPRDVAAVNVARKQRNSRRNQNSSSRNPTRYYQNSPAGKFDGLRPGVLDAETRKLLGLGELDPPPWLNRMREIGYPPGYLDPDDEDQPSGITIFADEESKEDTEEGEILGPNYTEPPRKMSVQFPGINAPIPETADKWLWTASNFSFDDEPRSHSHRGYNHTSDRSSWGNSHEQRRSRDYDDDRPPRWDPDTSSSRSYSQRHGRHDSDYTSPSRRSSSLRSPTNRRSFSERSRRSPSDHDDY